MSTAEVTSSPSVFDLQPFVDWLDDHRPLTDTQRTAARSYIVAIVARDPLVSSVPALAELDAAALWRRFREAYDSFRGVYVRSDAEDFAKALRLL